jgi:tetratricopeptide (TPR) repeat protein
MSRYLHILKISLAIAVAAAAWLDGLRNSLGCGPYLDFERLEISYLDPDLVADSLYQSYYRSLFRHIRSDEYYGAFTYRGDTATINDNVMEWSAYFGNRVAPVQVRDLIYLADRDALDTLYGRLVESAAVAIPDSIAGNALAQDIARRRDIESLRYIIFARRCEGATIADTPWESKEQDSTELAGLAVRGEAEYAGCRSEFLKLRYAYQLVRLAHMSGDYPTAIERYDRLVEPNPTRSIIRYWALGYKAGALKMLGDLPRSFYLFSQVFDSCEEHRELAMRDFTPADESEWNQTLELAGNDHERATLWMMRGLADDLLALGPLEKMYRFEPGSPRLEAMLLHQVELVEETIYSQQVTQTHDRRSRRSSRSIEGEPVTAVGYIDSLENFTAVAARNGNVHDGALWFVTAGYLALMGGEFDRSRSLLDEALRVEQGNPDIIHQARLLRYLVSARRQEPFGAVDEEGVVAELEWLREKGMKNRHVKYDKAMLALARKYLTQGDVPKAALCFNAGGDDVSMASLLDMYASNDELARLDERIVARSGNLFERKLLDSFPLGHNEMLDLRGTRLLRQGRYGEALELFRSIVPGYWSRRVADIGSPAYGLPAIRWLGSGYGDSTEAVPVMRDFGASQGEADPDGGEKNGEETFNKLTFTERIAGLQQKAQSVPAHADSAYLAMANLFYNSTYWGYSGVLWRGNLVFDLRWYLSPDGYPFNLPAVAERMARGERNFYREYGSRETARAYYDRARQATKNRELAAFCCYMMDISRKQPQTSLHPTLSEDQQDRTGYNMLKDQYRATRFYSQIMRDCGTYAYFRKQR